MTLPANQLGLEAAEISGSGLKKRSIDSVQVAGGEVSEASVRVSESSSSVAPNAAMKFGVESSSFLDSKSCEDFSYRKRAPIWESVTLEQWSDWKWQLKHKVTTIAEVVVGRGNAVAHHPETTTHCTKSQSSLVVAH